MAFNSATYQRERATQRKALCLCLRCPAKTDGVHVLCNECRPQSSIAVQESQKKLLEKGACKRCGQPKDSDLKKCESCRAKESLWHKSFNQIGEVKERKNRIKREKIKNDINFKLSENLRSRLFMAIRNGCKTGSAVRDLGCSIEELKSYLFDKFKPGMTWDNYGSHWHIDHVLPLNHFNLRDRDELLVACNFKNLQPLWAKENFSKGARILEMPKEIQHVIC